MADGTRCTAEIGLSVSVSGFSCSDEGADSWRGENEPKIDASVDIGRASAEGDRSLADGTRCTAEIGLSVSVSGFSCSDEGAESWRGDDDPNNDARNVFDGA